MDLNVRSGDLWADNPLAVREADGGGLTLDGYAVRFGSPSLPLSAMQIAEPDSRAAFMRLGGTRFREVVHPGALTKALAEQPDITLRYQHNMMSPPLGRTKAGTMRLLQDDHGLKVEADLPNNEWGRTIRDSVARGDISGMSIRFGKMLEKWKVETLDDGITGPVRRLQEIKLGGELSLVDFPAFPATSAAIRALAEELGVEPEALESAFDVMRDPSGRLAPEQKELIVSAVNARTDAPVIDKAVVTLLADKRERLNAIAR